MANNLDSNITRKLARAFLTAFETKRVHSKNVNTQFLKDAFNASTGSIVDIKRPTDYVSVRTPDGDITLVPASPIIPGKASGVVQDYFTTYVEFGEVEESLEADQLPELLEPKAARICTDLELDFTKFMAKNTALLTGTPGTAVSSWDHVAEAGAVMQSHGVPMDDQWFYTVNPYTQRTLASDQRSLGAGGSAGSAITTAHEKATITENFAGFDRVMTATTLPSYTTFGGADRVCVLDGNPDPTYLAAKDTMTQVIPVTGFNANQEVREGEILAISGRFRLNLSTREPILDEFNNRIAWNATVVEAVTLDGSGAGNLLVTGPAIFEAGGAYNTVDSPLTSGDVGFLLGPAGVQVQSNLFWHKQAFAIGSVPIKKLYSTDTLAKTKDGLQIRVSKFSDGLANKQMVRFDFHPAFGVMNPFFAGQGFGPV